MTSIAIYKFSHPVSDREQIWAIGDTRISATATDKSFSHEAITSGAKIFSIPIRVSKEFSTYDGGELLFESSVGMAYAGSTTLGLNLHAQLSQILPYLIVDSFVDSSVLSLEDIAKLASKMLTQMMKEINERSGKLNDFQFAEVAIFGKCPQKNELFIYKIIPSLEMNELICKCEDCTPDLAISAYLDSKPSCVLLGDKKKEIAELIRARIEDILAPGSRFVDVVNDVEMAPKYVLEALIHHEVFPTIGRGMQIMISDGRGVHPMTWARPQSFSVNAENYEMYSLFNFNVLEFVPYIGKANIRDWPCIGPHYDVDLVGLALMSEFQQELRRLMGKGAMILALR